MFSTDGNKLEPEFEPVFKAWKAAPSPESSGALLKSVHPIIDTAIRSYGVDSPTLRGKAKQMALQSFQTYDPAKGRLKTHLLSQLQSLRRASAKEQNIISLPEQVAIDKKHLFEVTNELRDTIGRDPSDAEIADNAGVSLKRMRYVRQFRPPIAEGLTMQSGDNGDDVSEPAAQRIGEDDAGEAWMDFVYADLGSTDRVVMDNLLGRNGAPKLPLMEIARRLGVTPSAVSQRAMRIQRMLDERQSMSII